MTHEVMWVALEEDYLNVLPTFVLAIIDPLGKYGEGHQSTLEIEAVLASKEAFGQPVSEEGFELLQELGFIITQDREIIDNIRDLRSVETEMDVSSGLNILKERRQLFVIDPIAELGERVKARRERLSMPATGAEHPSSIPVPA